jgi:hypothetical protein
LAYLHEAAGNIGGIVGIYNDTSVSIDNVSDSPCVSADYRYA